MKNKILASILLITLLFIFLLQYAESQTYPTKPVQIICPYTPGSSTDIVSRLIANIGLKYFSQPIIVVNKPGAGGIIAASDVINSKPDGYKIWAGYQVFFATTVRTQKVSFNPFDLEPLANFMELKLGMAVRADSPFRNIDDVLIYAKKNPDQLKWSHPGRGITLHMSALIIFKKAGVQTIDVPYKGPSEALVALLGNHVDVASLPYGPARDHINAGKIRLLMFYSDKRYGDLPNVPTALELGYPEAVLPTFFGLYIHKNTPDNIKETLRNLCQKISTDPEFKEGIEKLGEVPRFEGPEFIKKAIKRQEEIGIPILKEVGLYVEQ